MHGLRALAFLLLPFGGLLGCGSDVLIDPAGGGGGASAASSTDASTTSSTSVSASESSAEASTATSGAGGDGAGGQGGDGGSGGLGGAGGGVGGSGTTGCITSSSPGHHVMPCAGGIVYDVEIPSSCPQEGCGLIVDMHGYTMNAASEDASTEMRSRGEQNGYVIVQPTAPGLLPSWDQTTHAPLVFAFVADIAAVLGTDPLRAHAMGFSQGGGMTWRLVCSYAQFFASAAPIGALEGCPFDAVFTPSEEVDVLAVHGRNDAVVSFLGIAVPQRDLALSSLPYGAPTVLVDDGVHKATRWTTPTGNDLEFWEHDYVSPSFLLLGHCFPGSQDTGLLGFACTAPNAFTYGDLAMQFFLTHPKG